MTRKGGSQSHHGQAGTPLYRAWTEMKHRTTKVTGAYAGVDHDPRWGTFDGFLAHPPAGTYSPGMVLARTGDAGDYTPDNCRWATKAENARESNERRMHRLPDGRAGIDVARQNGIAAATYRKRISKGWTVERAATA